jgi:hypothetical protein
MAKHLFFVFSDAVDGEDAAYHDWYQRHIDDILALPGFTSAQRFARHDLEGRPADHGHLVLYELDGEPAEVLAGLRTAVAEGKLERPDPGCVAPGLRSFVYTPIGERQLGRDG